MSPSMRREWIEIPHGLRLHVLPASPSMRREWIEMQSHYVLRIDRDVSLHAEGVD